MTGDNSDRFEITDKSEFPSLDIALDEVRKRYEIEQARKNNIEVKIGGVVGINTLLISVVGAIGMVGFITITVVLLPALISTVLGLWALQSREYAKPGPETNEIFTYARRDKVNSRKDFIQNYRQAINQNHRTNNDRIETLTTCFWLTGTSFLLVVGAPIVESLIRISSHFLT